MVHNGSVNPCPPGPAPCVCPVKLVEELKLAVGRKLVRCVEKQRKFSLKCSSPEYLVPLSLVLSLDVAELLTALYGRGSISSALISWSGFWESGKRNWSRNSDDFEGPRSEVGEMAEMEGSISACAF
jgi:hypothetical protein